MAGRVLVVGSFNLDHVWSVDALPATGATRLGTYAAGPGGKGFNQAVAAARAGASTCLITALGDDPAAGIARELAADEGIDLLAQVHATLPSGTAGIFVDADGRNVITVAPGANAALSVDHVRCQPGAFKDAGVVLAQLEVDAAAVQAALAVAREAGALTVLNPAPANAATTHELLSLADVLTPNETELAALMVRHRGQDVHAEGLHTRQDATLHSLCQNLRPGTWVVTLGAHGAFVSHASATQRGDDAPFYRVAATPAKVVDTTGAGDAFSGALCAALAADPCGAFRDAVAFATQFAARSTERPGAALAMPRRSELAG